MKIRQYLGRIKRLCKFIFKVNWQVSIYLNFKNFPLNIAFKLPIICYGKVKIFSLDGKIIINDRIRTGIIQIGKDIDNMATSSLPVRLRLENNIILNGPCIISGGSTITVGKDGCIILGKFTRICSGVFLKAVKKIIIGDFSWITAECIVMDTDVHYTKNIVTGEIRNNTKEIIIGNYCWIVMRSVISKGAVLPDYTIVARNSFVNKDFSNSEYTSIFLAGSPARIVANSMQYLPFMKKEGEINSYFKSNPDAESMFVTNGFEDFSKEKHIDFNLNIK
jgi:acetyltransferase-like isoleucine patch superfamily enzyme